MVTDILSIIQLSNDLQHSFLQQKEEEEKQYQHLCLDRAYSSKSVKQAIIKLGYVPHIPYKRKRGEKMRMRTHIKKNILLEDGWR